MRWVGIDEAGYGPNLGPLVMTAVIAEGPGPSPPDLWGDLASTVARAKGAPDRLWVDDSKAILKGGRGRERLEAGCLATLAAAGLELPGTVGDLLQAIGAGTLTDVELALWLDEDDNPSWPRAESRELHDRWSVSPLAGVPWRIVGVRTVVVGPARFNAGLAPAQSKAKVHFAAFAQLLRSLWERAGDGTPTAVRSDKHGGRHFYMEPLQALFEDVWIDRGPEGPALSQYTIKSPGRHLELSLVPRADADDGLVALASIVSKTVREAWMDAFNAHWLAQFPDLRPTAGYPLDAQRFRQAIEPACQARGLPPALWWRAK
ncbi:RNase HII [Singulisphaera sp. GP187]|uniref:hypothetical protein n=1 Tax=Singulisphaera sp. GP187 TaxID=1882752 RepID=UPI000925B879|nr:hypothetical protein [Singulisphaera sp. GP187]SIN75960.1 RNase HII [Singulisphaera sp. GP187]